jgi:hypothetical protein
MKNTYEVKLVLKDNQCYSYDNLEEAKNDITVILENAAFIVKKIKVKRVK